MREPEAEVRGFPRELGAAASLEELLAREEQRATWAEIRGALAHGVRRTRKGRRLSQARLAELIGSSQPRVSMLESAHPSVSVSLMLRALVKLGAGRQDVAAILEG